MTNKQHEQIKQHIAEIQRSGKTSFKVPYKDVVTGFSHMSKEVILKGYTNSIGKTIKYLERDWKVCDVVVVGEEIIVFLTK